MSPSRSTTRHHPLALGMASLWLLSVGGMSLALATTPLYQSGPRLGLCTPCAAIVVPTLIAKIEPAKAG
jgi:hypothetical protein